MANKNYQTYQFEDPVTETAKTYYDLPIEAAETADHKHVIRASAQTDDYYTDSSRSVDITITGTPNLANPSAFSFDTSNCAITLYNGESNINSLVANLNAKPYVMQLFGMLDVKDGVNRLVAFSFYEGRPRASSRSAGGKKHYVGAFEGSQEYTYNEETRTLEFTYVAVENSPADAKSMAPFSVQFAGTETWQKTYTNTYTYYLKGNSQTCSVYLGKSVTADNLDGLSVYYDVATSAPKRNGYAWPDGNASESNGNLSKQVAVSDLANKVVDSDQYIIGVKTDLTDGNGDSVVLTYPTNVIGLSNNPFSRFKPAKAAYEVGETIKLSEVISGLENSIIVYSDGAEITLADVTLADNQSITASMSVTINGEEQTNVDDLLIENLVDYEDCEITLTIPTKYFGTLTHTYDVTITEKLAYGVKITDMKRNFIYGDTAVYGDDAKATLYDNSGKEIETGAIAGYLASGILTSDSKISGNQELTQNPTTIRTTLQNANYFDYSVYVSYCDNFRLSETNLGDFYVNKSEDTPISTLLSGITAKYTYHENTVDDSKDTEVDVANADLTPSDSSINTDTDRPNYRITFSHVPEESGKQTLSASASVNIKVNRFVSLQVSHTATGSTYYTNRTNTFVIPNDLVIKKVYNNPTLASVELTPTEVSAVQYRVAAGRTTAALVPTSSTIPATQAVIYVTLELSDGTVLQGSYDISGDYMADEVTSLTIGTPFNLTLGNKLSTYKNNRQMIVFAHYASGHVSNATDEIFTDYAIVQKNGAAYSDEEKVVMEEGETYYAKHNGRYFTLGYEPGVEITYTVPTGSISITGFQKTFINTVDKVDFRSITAEITYENTNSSTTVIASLDAANLPSKTTYALSCDDLSAFDGTEAFNITSEGLSFTRTITITAKNRFDDSISITTTISVKVIAIAGLTITRLAVRNPKATYSIGEKFLNASDDTLLDIYYSDATDPITVYLKDVPSVVATEPSQGTQFTRVNDSMTVTVRLLSDQTKYTTYNSSVIALSTASQTDLHNISAIHIGNDGPATGHDEIDGNPHFYKDANDKIVKLGWYILVDTSNTTIDSKGARILKTGVSLTGIKIYGYLEDIFNASLSARVILFEDYIPPLAGESNIDVKFSCYVPGNADKINKCHIAKLFGNNNAKNRLFVSGNPDYKNCDWHSGLVNGYLQQGEVMDANGDFSYFGDLDYCFYGQTDNEVMGYDHVATDKMVVLKSKSKVEPTNYFRTSSLIQALDASGASVVSIGGSTLYTEAFPLATGNIGAGVMNRNSVANLNGDTLFLSSDNTVCGLNIAGQVGDSQRISYSRSKYIDPELSELDLSDAVLWTDNTSLFLFAKEATYMTNYETFNSETGQYEWWKMDVKNARCAIELGGEIYFGSSDGSLYKFDKAIYYDCDKIFIEAGGALYVSLTTLFSDNKIVYAEDVNPEIDEGAKYTFTIKPESLSRSLYRKVASISNTSGNDVDLLIDYDKNSLVLVARDGSGSYDPQRDAILREELAYDGKFYLNYADGKSAIEAVSGSPLAEYYRSYTLKAVDGPESSYKLIDADGNEAALSRTVTSGGATSRVSVLTSANLCRILDGEYDVFELDKEDCSFKLSENGRELDIVKYGTQNLLVQSFTSELHKHSPVEAFFIGAAATLGSINYRKTIWAWTLSAFKEANDLKVCYATNEQNLEDMKATAYLSVLSFADKVPVGANINKMSFMQLDFGKSAVPRKFTYLRPLSVSFMSFGFKSDAAVNSILTATSIVYTVPMMGYGNR